MTAALTLINRTTTPIPAAIRRKAKRAARLNGGAIIVFRNDEDVAAGVFHFRTCGRKIQYWNWVGHTPQSFKPRDGVESVPPGRLVRKDAPTLTPPEEEFVDGSSDQ